MANVLDGREEERKGLESGQPFCFTPEVSSHSLRGPLFLLDPGGRALWEQRGEPSFQGVFESPGGHHHTAGLQRVSFVRSWLHP